MTKDKFANNFFRIFTILTPLAMCLKAMVEKDFQKIYPELAIIVIYLLFTAFWLGFITGVNGAKEDENKSDQASP